MRCLRSLLGALGAAVLLLAVGLVVHALTSPARPLAAPQGIAKAGPALVASFDDDDDLAGEHHEIGLVPCAVHGPAWRALPPRVDGASEAGGALPRRDRRGATLVGTVVLLI